MMDKEIYPDNIEQDPLLTKDNDMDDTRGLGDNTVYTMKAGQTFVERDQNVPGEKRKSTLEIIKSGYSSSNDKSSGGEGTAYS